MLTLFRVFLEQATKCYGDTFSRDFNDTLILPLLPRPLFVLLQTLWGLSVVPEDTKIPPNQLPNQWLFGTWFGALLGPFGNPFGEHLGDFLGSA